MSTDIFKSGQSLFPGRTGVCSSRCSSTTVESFEAFPQEVPPEFHEFGLLVCGSHGVFKIWLVVIACLDNTFIYQWYNSNQCSCIYAYDDSFNLNFSYLSWLSAGVISCAFSHKKLSTTQDEARTTSLSQ